MGRRLGNTTVHVHDENGDTRVYGPGSTVPDDDVALITNPKVWAEVAEDDGGHDDPGTGEPGTEITVPWVIVEGDLFLGEKGRFVTHRDKAAEFDTAEDAQARLEDILGNHPDAHIEASGELSAED